MSFPVDDDNGGEKGASSQNRDLRRRLDDVNRRLDGASPPRPEGVSDAERGRRSSALGKAFRLSTELVAGVFGGGVIGWLLDRWLGTLPLFLVVFLLLGIAAGLLNAVRSAGKLGQD